MKSERIDRSPAPRTPPPASPRAAIAAAAALLAVGCAAPLPPVQLYHLRLASPLPPAAVPGTAVWQLMLPVRVPDYLDRDALVVPQGRAGLSPLAGHRWAEPLREAVPRVLRHDLATLLGEGKVWSAPVPAGVTITRQLRIELLAFDTAADRGAVALHARWSIADPAGTTPPRAFSAEISAAAASPEPDAIAAAHRAALAQLARQVARSAP
jgi:hypothetical protein